MKTKIFLVGDDTFPWYVKAFYQGFLELGYTNTTLFSTNHYLNITQTDRKRNIFRRAQNNLAIGPLVNRVNKELLKRVKSEKPDMIFFYAARLIQAKTIRKIHDMGITVFAYNNDNPFAEYYPKYFWRHFRKSLKYSDVTFVYRQSNMEDCKKYGCPRAELLRSYYMKSRNYHMENVNVKVPKVVFIGHYEQDERKSYIKALLDRKIEIGVPAANWRDFEAGNPYLVQMEKCLEQYNEQINACEIAVVFLSKINKDTYTRRCFEIPATKTFMLAPYTDDLASMFIEDEEIVFFRNENEFVEKIQYYLEHTDQRKRIAEAGYRRVMKDGHEVCDRVKQIMSVYKEIKGV